MSTAVAPAPSRLGVVDDLLADCPSVRETGGEERQAVDALLLGIAAR